MKSRLLLCLLVVCALTSYAGFGPKNFVQPVPLSVAAAGDTIYIPGGTLSGGENAGLLESTINADTNANGTRKNVNRVYALNRGQYYFMVAPINVTNPTGTLTICGIASTFGTTKPIILITPVNPSNPVGSNRTYGSVKMDGVHFQGQQTNNTTNGIIWYLGTQNKLPQVLTINNCLFEFCSVDLFDATNETGAIGGWPNGAKFFITNSYFRNFFFSGQWWGSRVFQCKHPIDTCWVENCTVTTGGLTFLQQNDIIDFLYFNHNTLINQHKYWMLSPYRHVAFITNNIFTNQNWVGEDTNVTNSGQDPDKFFMSTINIDTNNATNGLQVQPKYWVGGDSTKISPLLGFSHMRVYVSDNVNFYDPRLTTGYYTNAKYTIQIRGAAAIPSYLNWAGSGSGPWAIGNMPGQWMNARTTAIFAQWAPPAGGFVHKRTTTTDPNLTTPSIATAAIIDTMAVWNQSQWGDARFPSSGILTSKYIYGDYSPTTLPGIVGGVKRDDITTGAAGITKFTDLTENFSQSTVISAIDNLPVGALIWDDTKFAAYSSSADWALVQNKYLSEGGMPLSVGPAPDGPVSFSLHQNYPNPFNPTTVIEFSVPQTGNVDLKVFNVLGQEVASLQHGVLPAGLHSVTFDASRLASGVYLYKITAGSFSSTKKMLLLK
ncbi:MAG TPA: T9SS type A sorting domain-containing protein [Bacteroidota bacterium]|nr:T9SS type A sorting domain-containing protein [Bacteroidota bacterium]